MLRRLRRLVVPALVAGLVLALTAVPVAGQDGSVAPAQFGDVSSGNVHADSIERAVAAGVLSGVSANSFAPGASITRGQLATLIANTLAEVHLPLPPLEAGPAFADAGATHGVNIRRLAAAGIVGGFADGTFRPGQPVSRAQLATILVNTLSFVRGAVVPAAASSGFSDTTGSAHAGNIDRAVAAGLLSGRGDGTFAPNAPTRRDQAATIAVNVLDTAPDDLVGEVWSLDQGTDKIHVYRADTEAEIAVIDVSPAALQDAGWAAAPTGASTVPHMIDFDSQERYAFVASTAGAVTIVIDARSKEVVAVLATGAATHMAGVTPDDSAVWVAAINAKQMVEIPLDLDADEPVFEVGRVLDVEELLAPWEEDNDWSFPDYMPVCHQYSPDSSEAWITLGPGWNQGGFFVLDLASGEVTAAWDPTVVKANCGVSVAGDRVVANWSGRLDAPETYSEGEWYVFDLDTKELLETHSSEGFDAHGVRVDPSGEYLWQVNRASDNGLVIDATTFEVVRRIDDIAVTPDILDFSADGSLVYISQRGPFPRSGAIHAAAGPQPGVAVVDAATGEWLRVIAPPVAFYGPGPNEGVQANDVHGVGFRIRGDGDGPAGATVSTATVTTIAFPADWQPNDHGYCAF